MAGKKQKPVCSTQLYDLPLRAQNPCCPPPGEWESAAAQRGQHDTAEQWAWTQSHPSRIIKCFTTTGPSSANGTVCTARATATVRTAPTSSEGKAAISKRGQ